MVWAWELADLVFTLVAIDMDLAQLNHLSGAGNGK